MTIASRNELVLAPDGGTFDAFTVAPDGGGPGILLIQEIFGLDEGLKAKATLLAGMGYTVLCPDVFWRVERNVALAHDAATLDTAFGYAGRFSEIPSETTTGDLLSALGHLGSLPDTTGRVAVMGYCLGGRLAFEVAAAGDPDACVSYYGSGIAEEFELAEQITCPTLLHFGGADPYIPRSDVARIEAAFRGRPDVEVVVQEQAGHAFENAFAPAFSNPEAAAESWPITVDFLERNLRR